MNARPLVIERAIKTLVVERGARRNFEVTRARSREFVIERSMLPGREGKPGAGSSWLTTKW
jgi:hypothetical protein